MKKQKYQIEMRSGEKREVEGYVLGDYGIDKRENSYYVLTHIPTGCLVESARTMKFLKMMLQEPEFFDFDGTKEKVPALIAAVARYRNEHGWKD